MTPKTIEVNNAEKFVPIPTDWQWKVGDQVKNQADCLIAFDRADHTKLKVYFDADWISSTFTITAVNPLSVDELKALTENAVKEFAKSNAKEFARDSIETRKDIVKEVYRRLFEHWVKRLAEIKMLDLDSFKRALAEEENAKPVTEHVSG